MKNNSSYNNNLISKHFIIKNQLKIQKLIILKLSDDLNNFQIAERELTTQIQLLESQKEQLEEMKKEKIITMLIMMATSVITLSIVGNLTVFTFIANLLIAFAIKAAIEAKIFNKGDKISFPDNLDEDLKNTDLALQYIEKMVVKLNQVIARENEKLQEIENNKHNEKTLLTEIIVSEANNYDKILEQIQKEIWDSTFEEIISEYDNNQSLTYTYE